MIEKSTETTALSRPVDQSAPKPKKRTLSTGSGSQAKEAIALAITSTDRAVADVIHRADEIAAQKLAAVKEARAQQLGDQIADSSLGAIDQSVNFILETIGSGQWLLSGASEILDGEVIE